MLYMLTVQTEVNKEIQNNKNNSFPLIICKFREYTMAFVLNMMNYKGTNRLGKNILLLAAIYILFNFMINTH